MTYYKVLGLKGEAIHGGSGRWHLPRGKRPGKWMPPIADPVPCKRGYHVVTAAQLLTWLELAEATVYRVEVRGALVHDAYKSVVEQARLLGPCLAWNPRVERLFAADCAERVLPIFEREYPTDDRPRKAIAAARAFARGEIDAAARDAAGAAAWAAAGAAAWDAARAAAWDAERRWQTRRLLAYLHGRVKR